jgi:hypothetical protein
MHTSNPAAKAKRKTEAPGRGPMTVWLAPSSLRLDGDTQPRQSIDETIVAEYAQAMKDGAEFPPVVAFNDGAHHWLADGFHRRHAAVRANQDKIRVDVRTGTRRDAVLYSVAANVTHGLRRTNADKRKAALVLLTDEEWGQWSDGEIARRCCVGDRFVSELRAGLTPHGAESEPTRTYVTRHGTRATMRVGKIGRRDKPAPLIVAAVGRPPAKRLSPSFPGGTRAVVVRLHKRPERAAEILWGKFPEDYNRGLAQELLRRIGPEPDAAPPKPKPVFSDRQPASIAGELCHHFSAEHLAALVVEICANLPPALVETIRRDLARAAAPKS